MPAIRMPSKFVSHIETQRENTDQTKINSGRKFYFPCRGGLDNSVLSGDELSYFASLSADGVEVGTEYHDSFGMCDTVFVPKHLEIEFD